jgi:hypothetical protein
MTTQQMNQIVGQFKEQLKNAGPIDAQTALDLTRTTLAAAKTANVTVQDVRRVVDETWSGTQNQPIGGSQK